jgi:hypothetical protein
LGNLVLFDQGSAELRLPTYELKAVPFEEAAVRAGRSQFLALADELADSRPQPLDFKVHASRVPPSPVDRMWKR